MPSFHSPCGSAVGAPRNTATHRHDCGALGACVASHQEPLVSAAHSRSRRHGQAERNPRRAPPGAAPPIAALGRQEVQQGAPGLCLQEQPLRWRLPRQGHRRRESVGPDARVARRSPPAAASSPSSRTRPSASACVCSSSRTVRAPRCHALPGSRAAAKKVTAFVPWDGCLNFIDENDEVMLRALCPRLSAAGARGWIWSLRARRRRHSRSPLQGGTLGLPGAPLTRPQIVKVAGVALLSLFKQKKDKPRS